MDEEDEYEDEEAEEERVFGISTMERHLSSKSSGVNKIGYFRSDGYKLKMTAKEKMETLWPVLVPDPTDHSVKPKKHMWKEFDNFFT